MKKTLSVIGCLVVIALAAWIYKYKFDEAVKSHGGIELPGPAPTLEQLQKRISKLEADMNHAFVNSAALQNQNDKQAATIKALVNQTRMMSEFIEAQSRLNLALATNAPRPR